MSRGLADRVTALEDRILRPPLATLSDAELQVRLDGYLARMAAGPDKALGAAARAMQADLGDQDAAKRLDALLRASLAEEMRQ